MAQLLNRIARTPSAMGNDCMAGSYGALLVDEEQLEVSDVLLGKGATAEVYEATLCDEPVAVKRSLVSTTRRAVKGEIELMSSLNHPNVLPLLGVVERGDALDLVTPLATNGTLWSMIHERDVLSGDMLAKLKIALGIAGGVEYLHRNGIVHRDLKPTNVLMDENARPMVADLGMAQRIKDGCHQNRRSGTYRYMAPEVMRRGEFSGKTDVYAFGILLWELFTGRVPYGEVPLTFRAAAAASQKGLRPNLTGIRSPAIADLIHSCWSSDPNRRPTMRAVVRELRRIMSGSPRERMHNRVLPQWAGRVAV